jgi:hypothetical protein
MRPSQALSVRRVGRSVTRPVDGEQPARSGNLAAPGPDRVRDGLSPGLGFRYGVELTEPSQGCIFIYSDIWI